MTQEADETGEREQVFDPTQTGPLDLYRELRAWVSQHFQELFIAGVVLVALKMFLTARYGYELPSIPNWLLVLGLAAVAGIILGFYPVVLAINALWSDEDEVIVELDPDTGDLAVLEVAPDRFERMTVLDHNGKERSPSYLHQIRLASGKKGVEVDAYDRDRNVAVASWMAGASNRDIRKHRHATKYIKRELSQEADKSLDALVNAPEVMRAQGSLIANQLIRSVEGVITPGDGESDVYKQMWNQVTEADVSGDLLADHSVDDIDSAIESFTREQEEKQENDSNSDDRRSISIDGDGETMRDRLDALRADGGKS